MTGLFGSVGWAWAALATLVILTLVFALDFTRRRRLLSRIGYSPMLERMMAPLSPKKRVAKAVLFTVGGTGLVLALAHPLGEGTTTWRKRGIDIAVVMDYSKSMLAKDVYPTRLERMQNEVDDITRKLTSDRIATVVFAGAAIHFPLTQDHHAAGQLLDISPADLPPGSDLGEALLVARCLLRPDVVEGGCARVGGRGHGGDPLRADLDWRTGQRPIDRDKPAGPPASDAGDRARAILLFTDGGDTENHAAAEVKRAVKLGIQVYVIGVGTLAGELVPQIDDDGKVVGWQKQDDGSFVTTRLDQPRLKELAGLAGGDGHYYVLDSKTRALDGLVQRLGQLKEGDLDKRVQKQPEEEFQWILFPAFLLLVIEACTSDRRRRRRALPGEAA